MTLAHPAGTPNESFREALPYDGRDLDAATYPALITTTSGREITAGVAEFHGEAASWTATVRQLDRPGMVASAFFADGVREVVLTLGDGRRARARLTSTSFVASSERVCELRGTERLARAAG